MKHPDYDALLIDIDGTLLGPDGTLAERTITVLRRASASGMLVMLVTGRSVQGTLPVHAELGIGGPCVCFNGLIIFDPDENRWIEVKQLPPASVPDLVALACSHAEFFLVTTRSAYNTVRYDHELQDRVLRLMSSVNYHDDVADLPGAGIVKIQCFCTEDGLERLCGHVESSGWSRQIRPRFFPLQSLPGLEDYPLLHVDFEPVNQGKAEGITFVESAFGIGADRIVAIGDQVNDIPMIEAAGLGVAMGNAAPALKARADRIIEGNDMDGLARFVEMLLDEGLRSSPCHCATTRVRSRGAAVRKPHDRAEDMEAGSRNGRR